MCKTLLHTMKRYEKTEKEILHDYGYYCQKVIISQTLSGLDEGVGDGQSELKFLSSHTP